MGDELSALGVAVRRGHGDLDAKLVRAMGLALADALHFRGMQGIDLGSALLLLLLTHATCPCQNVLEDHLLEPGVVIDLTGDVADDTAQIGPQRLPGSIGAFELLAWA